MSQILTLRDRRQLVRLLGLLQDHLESAIESCLVPGTSEPMANTDEAINVECDRRDWRAAEKWVGKLSKGMRW